MTSADGRRTPLTGIARSGRRAGQLVGRALKDLRGIARLLVRGRWRQLFWRLRFRIRGVDLERVEIDDLDLTPDIATAYENSGGADLDAVLRALHVQADDRIVDLGCGKGGALFTLARYPFARVTGVDISPEMLRIAEQNLTKLGIEKIDLRCMNAGEFDAMDDYNYLYLYNPFPAVVMQSVMDRLVESLHRTPRLFTIIYLVPRCHETIVGTGCFRKVAEYPSFWPQPFFIYSTEAGD